MALTLYDFLPSGNGYRVRLLLRELGLPFQFQHVDILAGETHSPWFIAKNPAGQIPVLELEDGTCLRESTAIMFHLARGSEFLPNEPLQATRTLQWLCFEQTNIDGVISRARFRRRFPDVIPTAAHEFEAWWRHGKQALQIVDEHLATHDYLVGSSLTIADLGVYSYVHCAAEGDFDVGPYVHIQRWIARIEQRPAWVPIHVDPTDPPMQL